MLDLDLIKSFVKDAIWDGQYLTVRVETVNLLVEEVERLRSIVDDAQKLLPLLIYQRDINTEADAYDKLQRSIQEWRGDGPAH